MHTSALKWSEPVTNRQENLILTTKELAALATANSLAIAEHNKAIGEVNKALAEHTGRIMTLHDSVKSLERVAELLLESVTKHDAIIANLEQQWQAYLNRLPVN